MRWELPAALALVLPTAVAAQSTSITPSFAVSEIYDGNVFVSPSNPQPTLVHRFGPRMEVDRRSETFSLIGRYTLDADYLQEFPDEGVQIARQLGSVELRYRPMRGLALEANAAYFDTRTPVELSTVTALDQGRVRARRISAGPAVSYGFNRRTEVGIDYLFSRDDLLHLTSDAHVARAGIAYRFTRTDTGSASLLFRQFVFDGDALAPSQVALLGWTRRFARRTSASVHVGPRFRSAEAEGLEADASVRHGFGRTELEVNYTRGETTTIGLPGSFETDAATLSAAWSLKPSVFRGTAGVARTHGPALQADVLHTRIEAISQVHPWLSVELSLALTWQRLEAGSVAGTAAMLNGGLTNHVFHDVVALTLVVAPPKPFEL